MDPDFLRGDLEDAFFVDCGGTYSGTAANVLTGLDWLAGETVDILADGRVLPQATVTVDGVLTLPNAVEASVVQYGLPIADCLGELLRPPLTDATGDKLGRKIKIVNVDVDLYESKGLKFRSDRDQDDYLKERPASNRPALPNGLSHGTFRLIIDGSWTSEGRLSFLCDQPLPSTIRAINVHVDTED
jgi:hypothetical protein